MAEHGRLSTLERFHRMVEVFVGSEALATGQLTRHRLENWHRRLFPDVYVDKYAADMTVADHATAAWLWSKRQGVMVGTTASALLGAKWVAESDVIEMNYANNKAPPGIITCADTLLDSEITWRAGIPVTTPERTAFDLARRGPVIKSVQRLDALAAATGFDPQKVLAVSEDHPRVRGRRRVADVLALVDPGAQSPRESWLRLLLIDGGHPPPETQIPILRPDGSWYFLDMGWRGDLVAVEYDGQHHRVDAEQFRQDVIRSEFIASLKWRRVRVLAGDRRADILFRVQRAGAEPIHLPGVLHRKWPGKFWG